ncbi:MAG: hypothetical protein KHY88_01010 [Erysipelotrichaceae bacterium]|nr:hypothetical protein [Erysipelotrichaceae bacterium]
MENIEQVFLYMKDEITAQASKEEAKILEEVNSLEQLANEQMEEEAKKDAALQMNQELSEISSIAAAEISQSHSERIKKLIEKRDGYVANVFSEAKAKLVEFTTSKEYVDFMLAKAKKVGAYHLTQSTMYVKKQDLELKDQLAKAYGSEIEIVASDSLEIGGLIVENSESKLVIDESLDTALENQKDWFAKNSGLIIK